ncbi:MAG: hypothetical protein K6D97_00895 [Clostridia bacterium]|nr:hypothetical protein [Clostridia bacterium]
MGVMDNIGGVFKSIFSVFKRLVQADTVVEADSESSLRSALHEAISEGVIGKTAALQVAQAFVESQKEAKKYANNQVRGMEGPGHVNKFADEKSDELDEVTIDDEERPSPGDSGRELD